MNDNICKLCQGKIADKKGSHLIPNFLLQSTFGINGGRSKRDKDVIISLGLVPSLHFGREVLPEQLESSLGKTLSDEDINNNPKNPFIKDYYFCSECEKRFSTIECLYAESLPKEFPSSGVIKTNLPLYYAHLFWLSVVWRISISDMEYKLSRGQEQQFRKILNNTLSVNRSDINLNWKSKQQLSRIGYYLLYFEINEADKELQMGVSLPMDDEAKFCNIINIGTYMFIYYSTLSKQLPNIGYGIENDLNKDNYNNCKHEEQIICFNSLAHECLASINNKRAEKGMVKMIQTLIKEAYGKDCSYFMAINILSEYYKPIQSHGDILQLSGDRLLEIISNKYGELL